MTRLVADDIRSIPSTIGLYDSELKKKTGSSLKEIAETAVGCPVGLFSPGDVLVAVIPVTAGFGKIEGFPEAVNAIVNHLGFNSFITVSPDVKGLTEAYDSAAQVIMLADDHIFAAVNLKNRKVIDNGHATAKGYIAALKSMAGNLEGEKALIIGAGQVGGKAAEYLADLQVRMAVYDPDRSREKNLAERIKGQYDIPVLSGLNLTDAMKDCKIIFDASPAKAIIRESDLGADTLIIAPGMPLGLEEKVSEKVISRTIHDPLQIGVATMLYDCLV